MKPNTEIDKATRNAAIFILESHKRVMQSDLQFGGYTDEIKQVICEKIDDVATRLNNLKNQQSLTCLTAQRKDDENKNT